MWLGASWAYQEGSWGGWWAWDPSEAFGLVILVILISIFHYNFLDKKPILFKSVLKIGSICVLLVYTLLQSNFSITSHNFGLNEGSDHFFKNKYLVVSQLLILTILYLCLKNSWSLTGKLLCKYNKYSTPSYYTSQAILILLVSLLPLLTDLIWKSLNINLVNINISYWALISTLMILILVK
jgi:cytochrome c biogenesis factor